MEAGLVSCTYYEAKGEYLDLEKEKADAQSDKLAHQPFIEMNSRCMLKPQSFDR